MIFARGAVLGVAIAAPVGPIGLLTIRRTLSGGFPVGIATGLGAATADATYGFVVAFGMSAIMSMLVQHSEAIRLLGGVALICLGIRGVKSARQKTDPSMVVSADRRQLSKVYAQSVALTLTNPATILSFIAMFAGIGIVHPGADIASSLILVAGVAIGSASWWVFLCGITTKVRHRLSPNSISVLNMVASSVILLFGVTAIGASL